MLLEDDIFRLSAFPVEHRRTEAFGFSFEEKARRPFLPEKAEALGVPVGPIRRDLVAGKLIRLPDGRTIMPDEVLGPEVQGIRVVFVGDAGRVDNLVDDVAGADLLAIEATYTEEEREVAAAFGHLTATQAAWLAPRGGREDTSSSITSRAATATRKSRTRRSRSSPIPQSPKISTCSGW